MSLANVVLVLAKELRQLVRDRRAVALTISFPIVVFPLVAILIHTVLALELRRAQEYLKTPPSVPLSTKPPVLVWLRDLESQPPGLVASLEKERKSHRRLRVEAEPEGTDGREALERGPVRAILRPKPSLAAEIATLSTTARIDYLYDTRNQDSCEASSAVWSAIFDWAVQIRKAHEVALGLKYEAFMEPVRAFGDDVRPRRAAPSVAPVVSDDVAPVTTLMRELQIADAMALRGEWLRPLVGGILALLMVAFMVISGLAPAVELGCGEKERGTLETLLLAPGSRIEIALGKWGAVTAVVLVNVALSLTSAWLSASPLEASLPQEPGLEKVMAPFVLSPALLLAVFVATAPVAALLAALLLALSTLAKSEKEASAYLGPVMFGSLILAGVGAFPVEELAPLAGVVPVVGATMAARQLVAGTATIWGFALAFASCLACALAAILWVVRLYGREEVLVRPAVAPGFGVFERDPARKVPTPLQGVVAALAALVLVWGVGARLEAHPHELEGLVATLLLVVAAPPVALALALRLGLRETFALERPALRSLAGALLVGASAAVLSRAIFEAQATVTGELLPEETRAWEAVGAALTRHGVVVELLALALLPGICEEILFRGFVLSGLGSRWRTSSAVVLSSLFFAVSHLDPARFGATFTAGVALALLVRRSRSIVPGMLAHSVHNGVALLALAHLPSSPALTAGAALTVLLGLLVSGARR